MDENAPGYDPRLDPRNDPRYDPRGEPRFGGRTRGTADPRLTSDPEYSPRRTDPRYVGRPSDDPRYAPEPDDYPRQARGRAAPPPPPPPHPGPARTRRRLPWWAILAGLIGLIAVALFAFSLTRSNPDQDRLADSATNNAGADPEAAAAERCGSQQTYDLLKRELFRRAAQVRGSEASVFDRLGSYATIRVQSPVVKRQDEEVGTLVCSGQVALDLPPGLGVVGGRRTLSAAVDYSVTPAADGSGNVVTLEGADPIVVPLATLARTDGNPTASQGTAPADSSEATETSAPAPVAAPAPAAPSAPAAPRPPAPSPAPPPRQVPAEPPEPRATASARPSFNCDSARTRGEVAVCGNSGLASLDRQMAGVYVSTLRDASPQQRALLQRTRDRFLGFRDRCRSDACIAGAYRDRIREIRDIANDNWNP